MRHREKVLAHAEQELFSKGDLRSEDLLKLYQKFIKLENHRIRLRHTSGGGGREVSGQRATVVDIVLRHLLGAARRLDGGPSGGAEGSAGIKTPNGTPNVSVALVAIGGYGRGELNPFSDVDLMFLHDGSSNAVAQEQLGGIVEKILYTLWDVGFKVGHSTRTPEEAIEQANKDML